MCPCVAKGKTETRLLQFPDSKSHNYCENGQKKKKIKALYLEGGERVTSCSN